MAKRVRYLEVTSPFSRLALLAAGMAVILALTGALSWLTRNTLQNMAHRFVVNISGSTAQLVEQHFQAGRRLLEELTARAESNRLAVEPPEELVRYLADRLRYNPGLAWVSYSYEKDGRFVGAWRQLDGTIVLNTSHPDEAGGRPVERVIQPDGKVLVAGDFSLVNGVSRASVVRLNADGSLDNSFVASRNGLVRTVALQNDGRVLIGGVFTTVNGFSPYSAATLRTDGRGSPSLRTPSRIIATTRSRNWR